MKSWKVILGSASPRRKQLLEALLGTVEVRVKNVDEIFPEYLRKADIPVFLAVEKAKAFDGEIKNGEIVITADTIVWSEDKVLNKPVNSQEALLMLRQLSGKVHQVFTGVCISSAEGSKTFSVESRVEFVTANEDMLEHYVDQYKPFDKAGAYGAQECLPDGMNPLSEEERNFLSAIGKGDLFEESLAVRADAKFPLVKKIDGSYFNVMGLPIVELYEALLRDFSFQKLQ